jgi:hypothetical protein
MEKINIRTFGKILKSQRRNTLFEQIVNNDIKIKDLAAATGITSDRLYRIFDIPTAEELTKLEYELTKLCIISKQANLDELATLGYHIQNPTENAMMDDNEFLITRTIDQVNSAIYEIKSSALSESFLRSRANTIEPDLVQDSHQ